ncbi:hypothetical protein [Georgenia sp. Marseille-Q6866]
MDDERVVEGPDWRPLRGPVPSAGMRSTGAQPLEALGHERARGLAARDVVDDDEGG